MQIKEVMTRDVAEIPADASLSDALKLLVATDGSVAAVYDDGQLLGTVTEHDIAAWQSQVGHDMTVGRARDVMRQQRGIVTEDQDIQEVARLMKQEHLPGMVVVKDHHPIGAVSLADVATRAISDGSIEAVSSAMPARVFLQPIAAPSILGFFGLAGAWFIVGAQMAGWFGSSTAPLYLAPFVALFGGLAQLLAGMWSYRSRDGLATAIHGMWGAYFVAYGILYWGVANHTLTLTALQPGYGWWFIPLAAITGVLTIGALAENGVLTITLAVLTAGCIIAVIAMLAGSANWVKVSGYCFVVSAICAWYLASAMLFEGTFRRVILPLGRMKVAANRPGAVAIRPVEYKFGEPGVRAGQ